MLGWKSVWINEKKNELQAISKANMIILSSMHITSTTKLTGVPSSGPALIKVYEWFIWLVISTLFMCFYNPQDSV